MLWKRDCYIHKNIAAALVLISQKLNQNSLTLSKKLVKIFKHLQKKEFRFKNIITKVKFSLKYVGPFLPIYHSEN